MIVEPGDFAHLDRGTLAGLAADLRERIAQVPGDTEDQAALAEVLRQIAALCPCGQPVVPTGSQFCVTCRTAEIKRSPWGGRGPSPNKRRVTIKSRKALTENV